MIVLKPGYFVVPTKSAFKANKKSVITTIETIIFNLYRILIKEISWNQALRAVWQD